MISVETCSKPSGGGCRAHHSPPQPGGRGGNEGGGYQYHGERGEGCGSLASCMLDLLEIASNH